jgi:hypothetical protein
MTAWISPATWVNGTLTAAFGNAEVRDHLTWLKAALDLLTNGTAADTGTATFLQITRAGGQTLIRSFVSGDTQPRLNIDVNGTISWGTGSAAADLTLTRDSTRTLGFRGIGGAAAPFILGHVPSTLGLNTQVWAVNIEGGANPGVRIALGVDAVTNPELYLRRSTGATMRLTSEADYRWLVRGDGGDARLGVTQAATGADVNSLFAWVDGDTQPRAVLGMSAAGVGRLMFGPGGATAPDAVLFRVASGIESDNTFLRLTRATTAGGALLGRVQGDGTEQFIIYARGHAIFNDGVATIVKAGTFTDADFRATPSSGTMAVDTTASKLWIRFGSTWKSVTLT